jgi:hypothetical protein
MGIFGFVALQNMLRNSNTLHSIPSAPPIGSHVTKNKYADMYGEKIIKSVIGRSMPKLFGWFDICPVNDAAKFFGINEHNDAYRLLYQYHCVHRGKIPREIRKRIPELIREALGF